MSLTLNMIDTIIPLSDRVLLRPVEAENTTASGIILPDSVNKERPMLYEVLAVGPGRLDKNGNFIKIELQPGDKVISGQYSGDDIKIEDKVYKMVAFDYILAKISQ